MTEPEKNRRDVIQGVIDAQDIVINGVGDVIVALHKYVALFGLKNDLLKERGVHS
jgi:hypothetical protein